MMVRLHSFVIAAAFAVPALAATEVEMSDVPEAVRETAIATAPGVAFTRVSAETENGRVVYEFEGRSPDGKHIEVDVFEDGTLDEIEMETAADDLPAAVKAAIDARFPGFKPTYIESSVRSSGAFVYEIEGTTADGVTTVIEIAEDGTVGSADKAES